jgi:hypothetical protein
LKGRICPVCSKAFLVEGKSKKTTCSYACSNTFFRSGRNNGMWKETGGSYRTVCFKYHQKKCVVCDEERIVSVHHYDENHENNAPENLIPLCPTHHCYVHSRYKDLVIKDIEEYRTYFITHKLVDENTYDDGGEIQETDLPS